MNPHGTIYNQFPHLLELLVTILGQSLLALKSVSRKMKKKNE